MYSYDDGVNPVMSDASFGFSWKASLTRDGVAYVELTAAEHPEEIRHLTLDVVDAAPVPGCTLSNGLQGCPTGPCIPGFCSSPPPKQQTARVYDHVFNYGEVPLINGQRLAVDGTATPINAGDPYIINACMNWYAYFTPEDNRSPSPDPDGHEHCDTIRIEASDIKGSPFGPFRENPLHLGDNP